MARTSSRFALTTGLSTNAKGAVNSPSSGLDVLSVRFTPLGT